MSIHNRTIAELAHDLKTKTLSSEEITRAYLQRIDEHGGSLNSYITVCHDSAIAQAKHADKLLASNKATALTGIPLAQKDIFCTTGVKTSCASRMLDNFIAPYDATVIEQFNQAGSVMLGKTNMDEFAMGSSNENSHYGSVKNPWNIEHVPGGSSGGSAAAVAARIAPAATGTDTGGSIRQPASFCGLTGIKPTYGRVSRFGMIAFASSLDQGGPIARTAEDAAILLQSMAGHDAKDSTSVKVEVSDYCASLQDSLQGLKVGLPKQYFGEGLDNEVASIVQTAAKELEKLGATLVEVDLPNMDLSVPAYYIVAPAEASSNLARFDGVRYGYRCEDPQDLYDMYTRSRSEGFGDEVKRRIMIGTYALSAGYYDAYYIKAQQIRRLISNDFKSVFESVDIILGPTAPTPAFKIGEKSDDPISMYLSDIYTIAVNLAGLPGLSMNAGFVNDLPVGVQLIGNYFTEAKLLNVAHQFQQVTDWHQPCPQAYS